LRSSLNLSFTAKVAVVIVGVNVVALAVSTWLSWSANRAEGMNRAEAEWVHTTEQIGVNAEGAVKWKKAEVIEQAYASYRQSAALGMQYFLAVNGKNEIADQWQAKDADVTAANSAVQGLVQAKPDKVVVDRSVAGELIVVAPLSLDKNGNRIGYIATAWSTDRVVAAAAREALMFFGKQALVIAFVIAAFLVAMRQFAGLPLADLARRIVAIREGDLDTPVPHSGRHDSIGVIANALVVSIASYRQRAEQDEAARQQRVEMERERSRFSDQSQEAAAKQARAIAELGRALERVATGDFSDRIGEIEPEFEKLRRDFNTMVTAVADALSGITLTASSLDGGAVALADSADQLAHRTESQAAALEQTAAALDEITSTIGVSAQKAEEASELVGAAKVSAHGSAAIVRDAIAAMDRIEESSSQIGQIIGVIDEIAFQTNLLALNAGVEAARAGEAGKGFAVVAQEVRALAQRSASAAKEIKQLVSNSGQEVGVGVALVDNMGESLLAIEQQIHQIDGSIVTIVASAREQSLALTEVNDAIRRMDQNTQQNAAMVEETNAACQELQTQSNQLKAALGSFHFDRAAAASAADRQRGPARAAASASVAAASPPSQSLRRRSASNTAQAVSSDWQEF
jgi:methyl-accepting chemotaxis protein